jgi:hypothetical protein
VESKCGHGQSSGEGNGSKEGLQFVIVIIVVGGKEKQMQKIWVLERGTWLST